MVPNVTLQKNLHFKIGGEQATAKEVPVTTILIILQALDGGNSSYDLGHKNDS